MQTQSSTMQTKPHTIQTEETNFYRQFGKYPNRIRVDQFGKEYVIGDVTWNRNNPTKFESFTQMFHEYKKGAKMNSTTESAITTEQVTQEEQIPEIKPGLRSIREITKDLGKPLAEKHVRHFTKKGKKIFYLAWHDAVKYLDHYAPGWCSEITRIDSVNGKLIITTRISIPCLEGFVYREATGLEDDSLEDYGDPSSNAESMALKRASAKFGLALYLRDLNK